jgi:HEAT repeat protein
LKYTFFTAFTLALLFFSSVLNQRVRAAEAPPNPATTATTNAQTAEDEQIIRGLLQQLNTGDRNTRERAAASLGRMRAKEAIPYLMDILKDEKEPADVICSTLHSLGNLDAKTAIPEMLPRLKSSHESVRREAAIALGQLGASDAIPQLLALFKDETNGEKEPALVRRLAAEALGRIGAKDAVADLLACLKNENEVMYLRRSAIIALSWIHATEAIPDLLLLLKNSDERIRRSAVVALGQLDAKDAVADLRARWNDPAEHEWVRCSAVEALGRLLNKEMIPELVIQLKNKKDSTLVRLASAKILAHLGAKEAIPELTILLNYDDDSLCHAAGLALGLIGDKESIPWLKRQAERVYDRKIRLFATAALASLGEKVDVSDLKELLNEPQWIVKDWGCLLLAKLKVKNANDELTKLLMDADEDEAVRHTAKKALEQMQ